MDKHPSSRRWALAHCCGFGTFGLARCGLLKQLGTRALAVPTLRSNDLVSNLKSTSAAFGTEGRLRCPRQQAGSAFIPRYAPYCLAD